MYNIHAYILYYNLLLCNMMCSMLQAVGGSLSLPKLELLGVAIAPQAGAGARAGFLGHLRLYDTMRHII